MANAARNTGGRRLLCVNETNNERVISVYANAVTAHDWIGYLSNITSCFANEYGDSYTRRFVHTHTGSRNPQYYCKTR